jgi:hypothetical protein
MSERRFHSRTYAALKTVAQALEAQTFPQLQGISPKVIYGDPFGVQDGTRELIGVRITINDDAISWERLGPAGRDEQFTVEVVVATMVPGRTGSQVVDRLEELSKVVEGLLYDVTSQQSTPLALPGITNLSMVASVQPDVQAGDEGYVGMSTIRLMIRSRI